MQKIYILSSYRKAGFHILFLLFFSACHHNAHAQRFYSVVFNQLPQDYQLYPRDQNNEANIPVSGVIELTGYNYMSVQVFRNQSIIKYLRAEIKYDSKGIGSFSTSTKIKAELAEYNFKVYACKSADSVLMVHRQNVVSGDAYLLTGQSNSTGFFTETATSEYCRSFGKITGNLNTDPYNPADTLWALSNQAGTGASVGTMGLEIQKQLAEKSGVPNCLINGGFHWSSAYSHAIRTENNPADLNNGYGRMLYRAQKAGLKNAVKGFVFRQGETEAYNEGWDWEKYFDKLRTNLYLDYPNLKKLYVFQIDIIYYPSQVGTVIREYQRTLPEKYPDIRTLATVGTAGFDGLHYNSDGYKQNGLELSRLMTRDFYQSTDTLNINSPSVKKVFYANSEKKQLVLTFDEGQQLVYPEKYKPDYSPLTLDMKDFFYLGDNAGSVTSGKADNNRIILELNSSQNATTLNYLPNFIEAAAPYFRYTGPYITNKRGMRAFTFFHVPIDIALDTPVLTAKINSSQGVDLSWSETAGATQYVLEKKESTQTSYQFIATLLAPNRTFLDKPSTSGGKISYRIKAVGATSESADYAYAEVETKVVLGVSNEKDSPFSVFPNPVTADHQHLTIRFKEPAIGTISLLNVSGKEVIRQEVRQESEITIKTGSLPASVYLIRLQSKDKEYVDKVLMH